MLFLGYSTGMRIRYFRKKAGLTQKELAEKIGLSDSALRNYELGNRKPDRDTLTCIADALQVSYYALSMYDMSEINRTLHFLFEMEEMYQLKPDVIDGELVLRSDTKRLRELIGDDPFTSEEPKLTEAEKQEQLAMPHFIEFQNVSKIYRMGEVEIPALHGASFAVEKGEICIIVGPSGAGKTTLLNILGGMDRLTEGKVFLDGQEISSYDKKRMTAYRRYDIGFVFQFYNLIQNLTARENVELAAQICKDPIDADEVLARVGLAERANNFPSQLSGGEQQRVAIARALAKNPKLLLCDEPTGALDYVTGKAILKLLQDTARQTGMTVVIITHNSALTAMADRIIRVNSGTILEQRVNDTVTPVEDIEW